ncbi:sigma E protease regulator RseP [soil metagenome]
MDFLLNALRVIGIIFMVLMVFNVIIIVHEWGHFLAGRWRGLKIEKFQIWFGKPIWKKEINGVQYGLGCIPAGGFVALPQMAPMEAIEGSTDGTENREKLPPISALDKMIVAVAGPLFSLGLAFVFACVVYLVGKPESEGVVTKTIGYVLEDSPAARGGLQVGDEIISVDGLPIKRFHGMVDSVDWGVIASEGDTIPFVVRRGGEEITVEVPMDEKAEAAAEPGFVSSLFTRPELRQTGIAGKTTPMVAKVKPNSPADEAGFQPNDLIVTLNGDPVFHQRQIIDETKRNQNSPMTFGIRRGKEELNLTATPRVPDRAPEVFEGVMLGIEFDTEGLRRIDHPGPLTQIGDGLRTMKNTLGAVFSPKSDVSASHLSGPVGIMRVYYTLFEHPDGWRLVLWFSVILNVNLAVLNMLPFPVLDGGHITMAIIEGIRRKPINFKVLEVIQIGCVLLLFGFMIFVTMKDSGDWVRSSGGESAAGDEIIFLPRGERPATE